MLQQQSMGFQPVRPIARPPHVEAAQNLLFGKPKLDSQFRLHLSNSNEISTNVMPTQIQAAKFVKKDESIDLQQAFDEVKRRASVIDCGNFDCSFERFEGLATECGDPDTGLTREAISILEGEMRGYYRNARREDYGPNVTGPDFVVEGLREFDHITHVEVKGAVSSSIRPKPILVKQAKKYVNRVNYQKNFWSDETTVKGKIPHINTDADLPKSPDNGLGLYDLWDVGTPEKSTVSNAIMALSGNDTNLIFLNQLETFEDNSIRCYYEYLWNYLVFENPFTEWLAVGGRKLKMYQFLSDSLALSYLKPKLARDIYQNFDKKPETLCSI